MCTSPTKEIFLVDQKVKEIGASYSRAGGAKGAAAGGGVGELGGGAETLANHHPTPGCLGQGPDLQDAKL